MSDKPNLGRDIGQNSGGFDLVVPGVLFALAGLWLDRRLGSTPVLTIALAVVGFVGSVLAVYYRYKRDIAEAEAETAPR